jgi:hypothetical protein
LNHQTDKKISLQSGNIQGAEFRERLLTPEKNRTQKIREREMYMGRCSQGIKYIQDDEHDYEEADANAREFGDTNSQTAIEL